MRAEWPKSVRERDPKHRIKHARPNIFEVSSSQLFFLQIKNELAGKAKKRTSTGAWVGLALMGVQFGFLARLTWWEYSWDIMEPVTYFITYGTTIAMYAYFVLTKRVRIKGENSASSSL
jgi:hypothetical protein